MTAASSSAPGGITAAEVAAAAVLCGSERCFCVRHASLWYCYGNEVENALVVCAASGAPSVLLAPSQ